MKRREAFATSGTRIEPRFFAGEFEGDLCSKPDWLKRAYAQGTPMGSKLSAREGRFSFVAQAKRDELSNPLEKLQLIKGWLEHDGLKHNKVINLVVNDIGANEVCSVYEDADYDSTQSAYYYVRAVETPSARWSAAQCAATPENERPEPCKNTQPEIIREMAWTSPIWITPTYTPPLVMSPDETSEDGFEHPH